MESERLVGRFRVGVVVCRCGTVDLRVMVLVTKYFNFFGRIVGWTSQRTTLDADNDADPR